MRWRDFLGQHVIGIGHGSGVHEGWVEITFNVE